MVGTVFSGIYLNIFLGHQQGTIDLLLLLFPLLLLLPLLPFLLLLVLLLLLLFLCSSLMSCTPLEVDDIGPQASIRQNGSNFIEVNIWSTGD